MGAEDQGVGAKEGGEGVGAHLQMAPVVCGRVWEPGEQGDDQGCCSLGAGAESGLAPCHEEEAQSQAGAHVGAVVVLAGLTHHHHRGRPLQPPPQAWGQAKTLLGGGKCAYVSSVICFGDAVKQPLEEEMGMSMQLQSAVVAAATHVSMMTTCFVTHRATGLGLMIG